MAYLKYGIDPIVDNGQFGHDIASCDNALLINHYGIQSGSKSYGYLNMYKKYGNEYVFHSNVRAPLYPESQYTILESRLNPTGLDGHGKYYAIGGYGNVAEVGNSRYYRYVLVNDIDSNIGSPAIIENPETLDEYSRYGEVVSVSGGYLAVSSDYYNSSAGRVYIYALNEGIWSLSQHIDLPSAEYRHFGDNLILRDGVLAISCERVDDYTTGRVYVYDLGDDGQFSIRAQIDPPKYPQSAGYNFGRNMAIHGSTLAIQEDGDTGSDVGSVNIYEYTGEFYRNTAIFEPDPFYQQEEGYDYGYGLALNDNTLAIGYSSKYTYSGSDPMPTIEMYSRDGDSWSLVEIIEDPDGGSYAYACKVLLSGTELITSDAYRNLPDNKEGMVYVYEVNDKDMAVTKGGANLDIDSIKYYHDGQWKEAVDAYVMENGEYKRMI